MRFIKLLCVLFLSQLADFLLVGVAGACQASTVDSLVTRLERFGQFIPQEKVYVHMDNTCYFLGDTIWFAAYTRQTNNGQPSNISRILYVELYNQDGYVMERQLIEMKDGRGHGNFVLRPSYYYGGFYELRAYTRWQLNWGRFEHPHSRVAGQWFVNDEKEKQFYRDYDKLYSRVFPVYDEPKQPGVFDRDMTLRPLRRYFKKDPDKRSLQLSFYPEGGQLVKGLPCRMAFEACYNDGEWVDGVLHLGLDSAVTLHRGRGTIIVRPSEDLSQKAVFTTQDGQQVTSQLPKVETSGVAVQMKQGEDVWAIQIDATADMHTDQMAATIMHEGVLEKFFPLTGLCTSFNINAKELATGVNQLTVFDSDGRVWADRLFFVRNDNTPTAELSVQGIKEEYEPFELVAINVQAPRQTAGSHLSLAVRDKDNQEYLYDSGNIMTEMLLASEIKGFVPQPEWYFKADDKLHREGLDLLMLTQGWRRFRWQEMAVTGKFELEHPAEKYQILMGRVTEQIGDSSTITQRDNSRGDGTLKREVLVHAELTKVEPTALAKVEGTTSDQGRFRLVIPRFEGKCVFFLSASDSTKWRKGRRYEWVRIETTREDRFEKARYNWRFRDKDEEPLRICIDFPYPRFVKPYHFYQTTIAPDPQEAYDERPETDGIHQMKEVKIMAKRNGLRNFNDAYPAFIIDAYDAYNIAYDAGFVNTSINGVVRAYVSDMGLDFPFIRKNDASTFSLAPQLEDNIKIRYGVSYIQRTLYDLTKNEDSIYVRKNLMSFPDSYSLSPGEMEQFNHLSKLDKYVIYTDYMPRMEGDNRYSGSNLPETNVVIYPYADGSFRATYRDRRLILSGFSVPDEFYHPNYSLRPLPDTIDYRRTLYWNPDLQLDSEGKATIRFYNNGHQTRIAVTADGMTKDGQLMTGSNSR